MPDGQLKLDKWMLVVSNKASNKSFVVGERDSFLLQMFCCMLFVKYGSVGQSFLLFLFLLSSENRLESSVLRVILLQLPNIHVRKNNGFEKEKKSWVFEKWNLDLLLALRYLKKVDNVCLANSLTNSRKNGWRNYPTRAFRFEKKYEINLFGY